ncbi:hypothetical protein acdb102_00050 [Acidothermaceae bacterium B102]|nr:hypothetical protein acdb102_00050 [Acidothermaceae bacterium B102]
MPISIVVRREDGSPVLGFQDIIEQLPPPLPAPYYIDLVVGRSRQDYPLLRDIDPYGNTCFNRVQATHLIEELDRLERSGVSPQELALIRGLRVLLALQLGRAHRYLWFIGD